jgi:murein DD-endopeptidase MepM/ murein hydrolase activator NlpD
MIKKLIYKLFFISVFFLFFLFILNFNKNSLSISFERYLNKNNIFLNFDKLISIKYFKNNKNILENNWVWPFSGKIIDTFSNVYGGSQGINIVSSKKQFVFAASDGKVIFTSNFFLDVKK